MQAHNLYYIGACVRRETLQVSQILGIGTCRRWTTGRQYTTFLYHLTCEEWRAVKTRFDFLHLHRFFAYTDSKDYFHNRTDYEYDRIIDSFLYTTVSSAKNLRTHVGII